MTRQQRNLEAAKRSLLRATQWIEDEFIVQLVHNAVRFIDNDLEALEAEAERVASEKAR